MQGVFFVYLTVLFNFVSYIMLNGTVFINDNLDTHIRKKKIMVFLRQYPRICLDRLMKPMNNFSQNNCSSYEAGVLTT